MLKLINIILNSYYKSLSSLKIFFIIFLFVIIIFFFYLIILLLWLFLSYFLFLLYFQFGKVLLLYLSSFRRFNSFLLWRLIFGISKCSCFFLWTSHLCLLNIFIFLISRGTLFIWQNRRYYFILSFPHFSFIIKLFIYCIIINIILIRFWFLLFLSYRRLLFFVLTLLTFIEISKFKSLHFVIDFRNTLRFFFYFFSKVILWIFIFTIIVKIII